MLPSAYFKALMKMLNGTGRGTRDFGNARNKFSEERPGLLHFSIILLIISSFVDKERKIPVR